MEHRLSSCDLPRPSCPVACGILVPGPGIETHVPCIGRQILNHWATRNSWQMFLNRMIHQKSHTSNFSQYRSEYLASHLGFACVVTAGAEAALLFLRERGLSGFHCPFVPQSTPHPLQLWYLPGLKGNECFTPGLNLFPFSY